MRAFIISTAAAFACLVWPAQASELPPNSIIVENCRRSKAILQGTLISSETVPNHFTRNIFYVLRVYYGPFRIGDEITYYTFRETGQRSLKQLGKDLVVFLVARMNERGPPQWGAATDFAELPSSAALVNKLDSCLRRKIP